MKKSKKKQPPTPEKPDKISIIVLISAALIFLVAFTSIYSEDFLNGAGAIFSRDGDEIVEFEKATVKEVLKEELEIDETADRAYTGRQELAVTVRSGRYKGEEMVVYNYCGPLYGVPVSKNDSVTLTVKTHDDGRYGATVYEFNRIPILAVFVLLFFVTVLIIGGRTGLKSMLGLLFTIICLFTILIPLLLVSAK